MSEGDLLHACKDGNLELAKSLLESKRDNDYFEELYEPFALRCMFRWSHRHCTICYFKINKNRLEFGLASACEGGHMEIVKFMIAHGAYDWLEGLKQACESGHLEIVQFMISKIEGDAEGDEDFEDDKFAYWDCALGCACKGGHMDVIQLMISKGASNWYRGLEQACVGGNLKIVKFMISKIEAQTLLASKSYNLAFHLACDHQHINIVQFLISKGANDWQY